MMKTKRGKGKQGIYIYIYIHIHIYIYTYLYIYIYSKYFKNELKQKCEDTTSLNRLTKTMEQRKRSQKENES